MSRKLFTDLSVERLKAPSRRKEIPDAGMPHLYLVVQPSGLKSWAVRYRYGGRPRKLTVGQFPGVGVVKARERAQATLEALDRGEDPGVKRLAERGSQHRPSADPDTFGVLIRAYFASHLIPHTRSWQQTAGIFGLKVIEGDPPTFSDIPGRLAARWAERPIASIRRRDLIEWADERKAAGVTRVVNRTLSALGTFFAWCVGRELIEVSPSVGMRKPVQDRKRDRILSDDELAIIWKAAAIEPFPFGEIVQLLALTGQRRGEVAGASWPEIDLRERAWQIPAARTKNQREHLVPLADAAIAILRGLPRFHGGRFLFGLGGRTGFSGFSKTKARLDQRIDELAGGAIPPWTLHDLRRSAATGMARIGILPHVVEAVLNHIDGSKSGIAGIYNLWTYEAEKRDALERWAAHILRLAATDVGARVVSLQRGA
jgi:integrase